ncbi:DnaB-like helicase N-terminal domain-containing protein [Streptomyces sp. TE33382]
MPRTPDTHDDALDTIPPPQPVLHVEQALLGALLLEPWRLGDTTEIAPESFSTAAHTALFAVIRSRPAPEPDQHAKNTKWLDEVLTAARQQARGLSAAYLRSLIQLCPRPPHAPAYARIVEAEHSRRRVRAAAQQLTDTSLDTALPHRLAATLSDADALAGVVDDIAARFPPRSGSLPRTPAPVPAAPHDEATLDEERLLLATATAYSDSVEQMRWLTPGDFTHPLHAGLWQCLTALARRGTPVDPLTVLWEAQHRGLLNADAKPKELLTLLAGTSGAPEYWGERILQRSVLATAHHVSGRIKELTNDPATTPYQLVIGSRRALADLSALKTRWQHATAPEPATRPARTRATAAPRAGPPQNTLAHTVRLSR